jgi:hypothetical protein
MNMKRQIFLPVMGVLLCLAACKKDFLSRDNPTATTDEKWWNTETDLTAALATVYEGLPSGTVYDYNFLNNVWMHRSGATDESVFRGNFDDWQDYPVGAVTTQEYSAYQTYMKYYGYIRNACRFMEHYQKAYVADTEKKNRYGAEARALRAWYHLQLFMLYGPVPIVSQSLNANEQFVKRNTQEEVVQFISSECDSAAAGLPAVYDLSNTYRISKGACYSMQTQLYMFIGDYTNAVAAARKVIGLGTNSLHPYYTQLFQYAGGGNGEEILYKPGGQREAFFRNAPKSFGCQACNSPTQSLVNTYETLQGKTIQELGPDSFGIYNANPEYNNNRDPRLKAAIAVPGEVWMGMRLDPFTVNSPDQIGVAQSTFTGYWIKKYVDPLDRSNTYGGSMNFMIIRYAEILLDYVEALIETGQYQDPDVVKYLNAIRNRAGMPSVDETVYNTKEKLRELVRRERTVELSFEGTRLYDIRRWNIGSQVLSGPALGAVDPATGKNVVVEQRVFNPARDNRWPIPLTEMTSNRAMEQNPGW